MSESVKIRCSITELTEVFERECGISNVVIESANDIDKLVGTLLAKINAFATSVSGSKIDGESVIIPLFCKRLAEQRSSMAVISLQMHGVGEADMPRYFIKQVKSFQKLFSPR